MTRYVVTGASGWLGRAALELLHDELGPARFASDVMAFGSQARPLAIRPGLSVHQQPLSAIGDLVPRDTILLHNAFLTRDRAETMSEADYVAGNRAIRAFVLEASTRIDVRATILPSSGAVYADRDAPPALRLYGALKQEDEAAFAERGHVVMPRIFNLSGRHINKPSHYALASFIADAQAGRSIRIRAAHPVIRSYVAIDELLRLTLQLAEAGDVATFDTAGDAEVEVGDLAAAVARTVADTGVERPAIVGPADRYVGNGAIYADLLARHSIQPADLDQQVATTAAWLASDARLAG